MTVRELRELLMQFDDRLVVFEERYGEHRELYHSDVSVVTQVFDAERGVLHAMDQQPSDADLGWLSTCPGFLRFKAWS